MMMHNDYDSGGEDNDAGNDYGGAEDLLDLLDVMNKLLCR